MKPPRIADNIHCIHPFYYCIMDYVLSSTTGAGAGAGGPGNILTDAQQRRAHRVLLKSKG